MHDLLTGIMELLNKCYSLQVKLYKFSKDVSFNADDCNRAPSLTYKIHKEDSARLQSFALELMP